MSDAHGLSPIAAGLWAEGPPPRLIGGRRESGEIVFPLPDEPLEPLKSVELSPTGTLWSWTSQEFQPKPPFSGPEPFEPFLLGYIELANEVIVESRIVETSIDRLRLGMAMQLVIVAFDDHRSTYAFRPEPAA
ncbi:MAG: OB-fold domain-containing protein [Sphingomonadales bacterium]|nr:OB-fold domain-containing protein [Sphingomonadales bacterium]